MQYGSRGGSRHSPITNFVLNVGFIVIWTSGVYVMSRRLLTGILGAESTTDVTLMQFALFVGFLLSLSLWLYYELLNLADTKIGPWLEFGFLPDVDLEAKSDLLAAEGSRSEMRSEASLDMEDGANSNTRGTTTGDYIMRIFPRPVPKVCSAKQIRALAEFSAIMVMVYVSDRTQMLGRGEKDDNMDVFWFVYACLVVPSIWSIRKCHKMPEPGQLGESGLLQRDQTEEWKGWMQVLFLLYHYYNAKPLYNAIRLFIAAYIWMTGFGNFSYYYIRKNYSSVRFIQMMWRLNFLVTVCSLLLNNSYMSYYICPLHTLWTLFIYFGLGTARSMNNSSMGIWIKIALLFGLVTFIFEVPGMWDLVFQPFKFMLKYENPLRPDDDTMQEWRFRSGLDRYIWIFGMICAYMYPTCENLLLSLRSAKGNVQVAVLSGVFAIVVPLMYIYYNQIFTMEKYSYNALHPFTSCIPIALYIVARNFLHTWRMYHNALFAWLGKITLETYILQYHIWLNTGASNYQPKKLLVLVDGWPMMNMMVCSLVYIFLSHRVFLLTITLRDMVIPHKPEELTRAIVTTCVVLATVFAISFVMFEVVHTA